jgi:hypothetical protein
LSPEFRAIGLWHSKGPASSIDIPSIFPYWLEALLEEIDGLSHLDVLNRGIIVVPPKVLD